MRVDLKVPYVEKDQAKNLGARWDAAKKVWYVKDVEDLRPFVRWIDSRLLQPTKVSKLKKSKNVQQNEQLALGLDLLKTIATEYKDSFDLYDGEMPPWI